MKTDILVIGGGASGLTAARTAAAAARKKGVALQVTLLEKMPRPARKLMISGKGRCNFTNLKPWNDFSTHIEAGSRLVKNAFYNFDSAAAIAFFEQEGLRTVVERGDRAFPASHRASDIVDTLVRSCLGEGVKIVTECTVTDISFDAKGRFLARCADGSEYRAQTLILATGGLSYPGTGSTGDGYRFSAAFGHGLSPTFPSLTALVPEGYKESGGKALKGHIPRETPLSSLGAKLCGVQLKNIGTRLYIGGTCVESLFGDVDFTDGGLEGPLGFAMSRKCVKALMNGNKACVELDLKSGVPDGEFSARVTALWKEQGGRLRNLLPRVLPRELTAAFLAAFGNTVKGPGTLAAALRAWRFPIAGFVGYERAVVTAGGIPAPEVNPKTMESRFRPGLYLCGELLDIDCTTGGYNIQTAFSTGALAGQSAALQLCAES
ncbi:MAG: aminoacetone oxidase family FAD-binding enzyme [Bacteroidales bacterium]|nr:aminoacetone oxidase family FAD-binding enzyme [Bacteroidales bacterium]